MLGVLLLGALLLGAHPRRVLGGAVRFSGAEFSGGTTYSVLKNGSDQQVPGGVGE